MKKTENHGKNLDIEVLRAFAISITIIAHIGLLVPEWYKWTTYFWLGGGVDLFFCISGLLITRSLLTSFDKHQAFSTLAASFWIRRLFRLWPAALFWSTLTLLLTLIFDLSRTFGPADAMLKSWFFGLLNVLNLYIWQVSAIIDPNPATPLWHYWSLSLEEQFYFILPLVLFLVPGRRWLIYPAIALALYQTVQSRPWGSLAWFTRSDALLLGTALGLAWHYHAGVLEGFLKSLDRRVVGWLMLCCLPLPVLLSRPGFSPYYMGLVAISSSLVVFLASFDLNLITRPGRFRTIAVYIGARSYSIYLVHYPVLGFVREICLTSGISDLTSQPPRVMALLAALVLTLLLAEFSFRYIETPLRKKGVALSQRRAALAKQPALGES